MSSTPVRDLEIKEAGPPWGWITAAAAGLLVLGGAWWFSRDDGTAPDASATNSGASVAASHASVTIDTEPPGATVLLDGQALGAAPLQLTVQADDERHELCIEFELGGQLDRRCRTVTGTSLAAADPYRFDVTR